MTREPAMGNGGAIEPVRLQENGAEHDKAGDTASGQPRILVVDDDDIMRKLMTKILKAQHYEVDAASNAFTAMRSLESALPDLILMDVQMPTIDGIELTRRLKSMPAFAGIPVLMLTGRGEQQIIDDCRRAGATDYIVKPFERSALLEKLRLYAPLKSTVTGAA